MSDQPETTLYSSMKRLEQIFKQVLAPNSVELTEEELKRNERMRETEYDLSSNT